MSVEKIADAVTRIIKSLTPVILFGAWFLLVKAGYGDPNVLITALSTAIGGLGVQAINDRKANGK